MSRNKPYAGGFITEHYGNPAAGLHAIQLELNRALYMDERRFERTPSFARVASDLETLAERLAAMTYPSINRFFFTSGGGESTDSSIKVARSYWKLKGKPDKTKVISRQWGYHGVTLAAMSATGIETYWPMFEPRVPGFSHIPAPYSYRYQAPAGTSPAPVSTRPM